VFRFSMNPAALGITEGIQDAFAYLQQTWRMWLPVVIAIAVCSFGVYAIVGSTDTQHTSITSTRTRIRSSGTRMHS